MPEAIKKGKESSKSNEKSLKIDGHTKIRENNKKLSFFPDGDDSDARSENDDKSPVSKLNGTEKNGIEINSGDNILETAISSLRNKNVCLDNDDATSTGSCSCENHSSVGAKSDEDPHGDLDYDEDSITNSPSNRGVASLENQKGQPNEASIGMSRTDPERSKARDDEKPRDCAENEDSGTSDDESDDDNDEGEGSSRKKKVTKLKSFICINRDEADADGKGSETGQTKNDRSHKSYHGLLKYFFKDACYFQIKSINHENVEISKSMGIWSTPFQNEVRLNAAFHTYRNVILVFSVQQSGAFQGFARMTSEPRPADKPLPWILPERLNRASLGGVFNIDWLCTCELSFNDVRDLHNPMNQNKPIKVARDGQQVDPVVARELCMLFPRDSKKRLAKCIETLKSQSHKKKPSIQSRLGQPPPLSGQRPFGVGNHRIGVGDMTSQQLYPPTMNGYHATMHGDDRLPPSHHYFHHNPHHVPYEICAPLSSRHARLGPDRGRRANPARNAHLNHPAPGPYNYNTNNLEYPHHESPILGPPLGVADPTMAPRGAHDSHPYMGDPHPYYPGLPMASQHYYHPYPLPYPFDEHWGPGPKGGPGSTRYHPYSRGTKHR